MPVWPMIVIFMFVLPIVPQSPPQPAVHTEQLASNDKNPNTEGVYHKGAGLVMPEVLSQREPDYSKAGRKKKISGSCSVSLVVDTQGMPQNVHISRSLAETQRPKDREASVTLDTEAVKAVKEYRFKPGLFEGKPVPVEVTVDISFAIY